MIRKEFPHLLTKARDQPFIAESYSEPQPCVMQDDLNSLMKANFQLEELALKMSRTSETAEMAALTSEMPLAGARRKAAEEILATHLRLLASPSPSPPRS